MAKRPGRSVVTLWLQDEIVEAIDQRARIHPTESTRTAVAETALLKHLRIPRPERPKRGRKPKHCNPLEK